MEDYECCTCSSKKALDFEVTATCIINLTQENFDSGRDIAEALIALDYLDTESWRPTTQANEAEDESARNIESREFEFHCKGESADYRKRTRECKNTLIRHTRFCGGVSRQPCVKGLNLKPDFRELLEATLSNHC